MQYERAESHYQGIKAELCSALLESSRMFATVQVIVPTATSSIFNSMMTKMTSSKEYNLVSRLGTHT